MHIINFLKIIVCLLVTASNVYAFNCFITAVKDSCWQGYEIKIDVIDVTADKKILSMVIPKDQDWVRVDFSCYPKQSLLYTATFHPLIWENNADTVYKSKHYWFLPETIKDNEIAWEISLCYTQDFAETPLPAKATGHCICDFSKVPPIK